MWIVQLALRRPYTIVVAALLLLLSTPFVLSRTPTDIFPDIDIPVVSTIWTYTGLDAREIEQRLIYNHERALSATVNDIEHVESSSYNGVGVIKVFLQPGASVDGGVAQITAVAQFVLRQMPPGQVPPLIIRYSASTVPILQYGLTSSKMSEQELYDLAFTQARVGLSTVRGAAVPYPFGGRTRVVSVDLDLPALKAHSLSPEDVVNAMTAQNLVLPSGSAKIGGSEYDVTVNGNPLILQELNALPIKSVNGTTLYLRDVAQVRDGYLPQQEIVRQDGVRGALLTILKIGAASTLDVVQRVKAELPAVLKTLPPELEVKEFADQSLFVRAAVNDVIREGVIAALLTAVMILLFLGSWRSTFIITLSIPLSVLSSIALLSALGDTINLMTLGGLALAVGILVDDATVAVENIHAHVGSGKPLHQAILDSAQEIGRPAFVSTLCICIVFAPMFFLTGVAHFLFVPLAKAVAFAVLSSYVLSRTLVPTLVMWLYRDVPAHGLAARRTTAVGMQPFLSFQASFERGFERFRAGYGRLLSDCMQHRKGLAAAFMLFCAGSWLMADMLGEDFFPAVDAGQFRLHVRAVSGSRIEETARLVDQVEGVIRDLVPPHELAGVVDTIGVPSSGINLSYSTSGLVGPGDADVLVSLRRDHRPTRDYIRELRKTLARNFPGTLFYFLPADIVDQTLNFGLPAPFDIQVVGRNESRSREIAVRLADEIRRIPGAVDVRVQQPADRPKLEVSVNRDKASKLGLTERDVANSVLLNLSGSSQVHPTFWLNPQTGVQYLVNVRAPEHAMTSLAALDGMPISASQPGQADGQILANLATVRRANGPPLISHYNVVPVIDIFGSVDGRDLGSVMAQIDPLVARARAELPRGGAIVVRGQASTMYASYRGIGIGLVMAITLVYFLLVINFQSWLIPLIIISALPGALAGVVWALYLTQTTLSVPALMGAIMTVGVATINSVLVVSFASDNVRRGMTPMQAALEAGVGRVRPVLITALAMVIGMLPMSLGWGEGGEQNAPLGRAAIGGLTLATVASLFFVPIVFSLLHGRSATSGSSNEPSRTFQDPSTSQT